MGSSNEGSLTFVRNWALHRIWAEFADPVLEVQYQESRVAVGGRQFAFASLAMGLFLLLGVSLDLRIQSDSVVQRLLLARFSCIGFCIGLSVLSFYRPTVSRLVVQTIVLFTAVTLVYSLVAYHYAIELDQTTNGQVYAVISFATFLIVAVPLRIALVNAVIILTRISHMEKGTLGSSSSFNPINKGRSVARLQNTGESNG